MKVTVPSELEGIAYIQVTIQRDNEQLVSATLGQLAGKKLFIRGSNSIV